MGSKYSIIKLSVGCEVKSDAVLPTAHRRCSISSKGAVFPAVAMMGSRALPTHYTLWRITASI